ncbi:UNVERIFIED_CONTAM: hypothetical protein K2H54_038674 [Gekko kuhli]
MQPACVRADSLLLSRSPAARDQEQQVQLRQKLRELPALLRSGLTLRRKNSTAGGRMDGCVCPEAESTACLKLFDEFTEEVKI